MYREERSKVFRVSSREREKILVKLRELLRSRDEIVLAIVFGGFLEDRDFHDIDIGIYLNPLKFNNWLEMLNFLDEISEKLSKLVNIPVDLVLLNEAPQWLRYKNAVKALLTTILLLKSAFSIIDQIFQQEILLAEDKKKTNYQWLLL